MRKFLKFILFIGFVFFGAGLWTFLMHRLFGGVDGPFGIILIGLPLMFFSIFSHYLFYGKKEEENGVGED